MDPNQFQFQENIQNVRQKKNASYFRMRAREILTGNYWLAFAVALVAGMLGGTATSGVNVSIDLSEEELIRYGRALENVLRSGELWSKIVEHMSVVALFAVSLLGTLAITLFLSSPVRTGYARYNLGLADARKPRFEDLFFYFKNGQYLRTVKLGALYTLISIVALIPVMVCGGLLSLFAIATAVKATLFGISSQVVLAVCTVVLSALTIASAFLPLVVQYRYYYAFHILADCPDVTPADALRNSETLMKGRKWKLFCLHFSFIGWIALAAMTCGVGSLFLTPYTAAADVAFYDDASQRSKVDDTEFPSLDPDDYDPNLAEW